MHLIDASNPKNRLYVSQEVIDCMQRIPPIAPESLRPQGEWKISSDGYYPYCSNCKDEPKNGVMTKFCPNCGAKMKGEGEDA